MDELLSLLETDPSSYVSRLERLVRESSQEELLSQGGGLGHRCTRREIVWAAERLAAFPEYFPAAEYILRRLALAESEPGIGNNATGIWRQLFRVWLSGTSVPFLERLRIFRGMLFSAGSGERDLALGALDGLLKTHVSRMGTPSVIGGRIPPADWRPQTYSEIARCFNAVFDLLGGMLSIEVTLAEPAWSYLTRHLRMLLHNRGLSRLQVLLGDFPLPQWLLGPWLEQIEDYLQYECGDTTNAQDDLRSHCEEVRAWKDQIKPTDFDGRLRAAVGKDIWHHRIREDVWKSDSELDSIADEIMATPRLLEESLDYLCSPESRSAISIGMAIGRRDVAGSFFNSILAAARQSRATALLRGYAAGLLAGNLGQAGRFNQILDSLEAEDCPMAIELILGAPESTDPATRIVRMVKGGHLTIEAMQFLLYGGTLQRVSSAQFHEILSVFDAPNTPAAALKIASDIIGMRLRGPQSEAATAEEDPQTIERILSILEISAAVETRGDFWWGEALAQLADRAPARVALIAALAIAGDDYDKQDRGVSILAKLAESEPKIVMAEIGPRILDPESGWKWQVGPHKEIFAAFSVDVVMEWLNQVGVDGARRIARHLPSPFTTEGKSVVPELTQEVLAKYGNDEAVLGEFCAGGHDLEVSCGDLADVEEGHARAAEPFLDHPEPAIRKWAAHEVASTRSWAALWRKQAEDEHFQP